MLTWLASRLQLGLPAILLVACAVLALPTPSAAVGGIEFEQPLALIARSQMSFVWRDVNQDGRVDLVGSWEQGVMVYLRRTDGGFLAPDVYTLEPELSRADPHNLRIVEDFNGDGFPDIYSIFNKTHRVMQNDGSGHFATASAIDRTNPMDRKGRIRISPRPVDVDNDGRRDIIGSPAEVDPTKNYQLLTLKSIGNCQFADIATGIPNDVYEAPITPQRGLMIYPGVFNNDRNFDLSVIDIVGSGDMLQWSTKVYSGQGNAAFTPMGSLGFEPRESCAVGDLNNDGIADVAGDVLVHIPMVDPVDEYQAFIQIRYGNGAGGFTSANYRCDDRIVSNLCISDMNLDGWNDLIFRSYAAVNMPDQDSDFLNIYINDKAGGFIRNSLIVKPLSLQAIQIVDFDQDGAPDILAHKSDGFLFYRNLTPPRLTRQAAVSLWSGNRSGADVNSHIDGEATDSVVYSEGIVGDAFEFTDFGGSVRIPDDERLLGSPSITIAAWVKARSYPTSSAAPSVIYMRGSDRPNVIPLSLRLEADKRVWLRTECFTDREGISAQLSLSRWTHVAGVFDAKRMLLQLYFDGTLMASKGVTFLPARALGGADRPANAIGNHSSYPLGPFDWSFRGQLDEVQFFDRALAQTEVRDLAGFVPSGPPAAPSSLKVTTESDVALLLSWEDGSFNESRFELQRRNPGGAFFKRADLVANTVAYRDTGLLPATSYSYRVRAVNSFGASEFCPEASGKTLVTGWPAPSNLEASSFNARKVGLFWDDNTADELGFYLERSLDGVHYTQLKDLGANTVETFDLTALPNTKYWYRIRGAKGTQNSAWSNVATVITPPDPPIAPTFLTAEPKPNQSVLLTWQDKSSTETRFRIEMSEVDDSYKEVAQAPANTTFWTSAPLKSNTTYLFRVRAQNAGGLTPYTNVAAALTFPVPVTDLTIAVPAAPAGESRLELRWVDPNSRPAKSKVVREKAGAVEAEIALNAGVVRYSDTGLAPSTTYKYSVIALNTSGTAAATSKTATTLTPPPPPDPPLAPDQLTCTIVDAKSASLTWRDRSTDETSFEIERSRGAGFARVKILEANRTSWLDATLQPATTYVYRARAVRIAVNSAYSAHAGGTTPPLPPAAPASLTASADGIERVNLNWADKSINETGFRIERATGANGAFSEVGTAPAAATAYSDSAISPATTYRYRVLAENSGGRSAPSNVASITLARLVRGSLQVSGALGFGAVKVRKSKTLTLTFKNISATEKLSLEIGVLSKPFAVVSGGGAGILGPGASRTVQVSFKPRKAKKYKDTLTAATSDPQHPTLNLPTIGKGK